MVDAMLQPAQQSASATPVEQPSGADARVPEGPVHDGRSLRRRLGWLVRAKFALARWFLWAWARSFSLKGLYLFGRFFGTCEYLVNFKRRARYRRELRRMFPEGLSPAREKAIILSYFRRTRCDKLFYLIFDRLPRDKILRRIRFHGRQHLDEALQRGHGAYVMLSHHGSHHIAALLMALLGYRCAGVRDRNEGAVRVYMQELYSKTFPEFAAVRVLYADSFPREVFRCFRENRVVGSASDVSRDRGPSLRTCPVKVFGQQREFLTGPLQMALRCQATVLQGFVVSRPNFYFRLIVHPPLFVPGENGERHDDELVARLMQLYADGIAAHMRGHPDHLSRI